MWPQNRAVGSGQKNFDERRPQLFPEAADASDGPRTTVRGRVRPDRLGGSGKPREKRR